MASVPRGIVHQSDGGTAIECLPLEEVKIKAWVVDVSSRITLTQTFYNPSNEPTNRAKYVFPLPANAAVCAFDLELEDGTVIFGEVKEKGEAALTFTRAVEQGRAAALVERVTDDIFTISVGSIPAKMKVTANLTFVMDLLDEALRDHVRLQLPMHIAERYGTPPAAMHDASAAKSQTRVHINVDIQTSDVIHAIRSPTHQNSISFRRYKGRSGRKSQRRMSVVWKSPEFLTSDFVITIYAEGLDKPRCFAEVFDAEGDEGGKGRTLAMQLTLVPKFLAPKVPSQEYIFIIDRSGSMSNGSIDTAKRTLTMLLRLLPSSQTTFNIFSFGDRVTGLWPSSHELEQTSLTEVTKHVEGMSADYGGTKIPGALDAAFKSRRLDRPAVVFLLTDGQVHGGEALDLWVSNAVQNSPPRAPLRLFVLGIGTGVSSAVCSSLARHGEGEYLFTLSAEGIYGKCARLLNAGRSKNIERIDVDWGYNLSSPQATLSPPVTPNLPPGVPALAPPPPVQQAPHLLKKIFSGIRFTVFAITSFSTTPTSVRLTTKLEGVPDPLMLIIDVTKVKPFRDTQDYSIIPMVHTLAARRLIMELDDQVGPLPMPAADTPLVTENDLRRAAVIRLGLTYQLVSKHTSFVAVQKGDERIRSGRRGSSNWAWTRLRLRQTERGAQVPSSVVAPTFLDSLIDGTLSFFVSVFDFLGGSATLTTATNTSHSRPHHQPDFPGAFDESNSSTGEGSRGRGGPGTDPSSPIRRQSPASHHSIDTFSSLSSLEGSSCSSCWTPSRSPSPLPLFEDPVQRAPSPEFQQGTDVRPGSSNVTPLSLRGPSRTQDSISREVYELFRQMNFDGSFTTSPLLTQLVGEAVLNKADELRIDRKVWATVVVAAYMKKHLGGEPDLLELVSEKAKEFVEAYSGPMTKSFDEMVREAVTLLNA